MPRMPGEQLQVNCSKQRGRRSADHCRHKQHILHPAELQAQGRANGLNELPDSVSRGGWMNAPTRTTKQPSCRGHRKARSACSWPTICRDGSSATCVTCSIVTSNRVRDLLLDPAGATGKPGQTVVIPDSVEAGTDYRVVVLGTSPRTVPLLSSSGAAQRVCILAGGTLSSSRRHRHAVSLHGRTARAAIPVESERNRSRSTGLSSAVTGRTEPPMSPNWPDDPLLGPTVERAHGSPALSEYSPPQADCPRLACGDAGTVDSPSAPNCRPSSAGSSTGKDRVVYCGSSHLSPAVPVRRPVSHLFWRQLVRWLSRARSERARPRA